VLHILTFTLCKAQWLPLSSGCFTHAVGTSTCWKGDSKSLCVWFIYSPTFLVCCRILRLVCYREIVSAGTWKESLMRESETTAGSPCFSVATVTIARKSNHMGVNAHSLTNESSLRFSVMFCPCLTSRSTNLWIILTYIIFNYFVT
jgi:hypothetical protein